MEQLLTKKVNDYIEKITSDLLNEVDHPEIHHKMKDLINKRDPFTFDKSDFKKKTRVKSLIDEQEQCMAIRANNTRCTRRKRPGGCYCGTHVKGLPYGCVEPDNSTQIKTQTVKVFVQDINGIPLYVDDRGNIYETEDILNEKQNPNIIGRYSVKHQEHSDVYYRVT